MSSLDLVRLQEGACRLGYSTRMGTASSSSVLTDGCGIAPLEIWVQAIQLSPYRAGLARPVATTLWPPLALGACCCPRYLSARGKLLTQRTSFSFFPSETGYCNA